MSLRSTLLIGAATLMAGCGSAPKMTLSLESDPVGAQVYLSRRGDRSVQGKVGPLSGNMKSESFKEEFSLIGTSPLTYESPLTETESDATFLGFGGRVKLKYKEGVIRFERPGYDTVERHFRFQDDELRLWIEMNKVEETTERAVDQ